MMAFIGQAVASASTVCQMQSVPSQSHQKMAGTDTKNHSQHMGLDSSSTDEIATFDRCPACDCSLGGCIAVVLPESQSVFAASLGSLTIDYNELAESELTVSLYRPPIAR